ncbi:hypothetical protein BW425_20475 [Bacillus pseudomycoides]|uniref:Uncharacterized protein n=1 Tax=Bacillus pseudomycoides TaxID=64104 RepID=A0A1Y3M9I5_9BACI|nr:hypothetical protein BW425_20475 [Bacillus pseudomycoides]PEK63799.1 hypothetical protein CN590_20295 [Bacillus pseudomycoides]PEL31800.1 hypothetical protein CN608_06845 [Bacillus pseudomycoides]PGE78173.1 hypothetical protein COM55_27215 [Bacillus pseudomycoides]
MLRRRKGDLHSFSLSVFTWHGAGRGSDRFYARPDALFHLKRKGLCRFFNLNLYTLKLKNECNSTIERTIHYDIS